MPAVITAVDRGGPAERAGLRAGDTLLAMDGMRIGDVFDYQFYSYDEEVDCLIERGGKKLSLPLLKEEGEDPGLRFETYLMDRPRACANKCVFCFIDQMPPGMRKTLYFKDDDARLSFLQGNYITLTNLAERDIERIIRMRISPLGVSIHTTNPALRNRMLGSARGGGSLELLSRLCESGLTLNGQIVLCPGLNDGEELRRTLGDLASLAPSFRSVSVVPVGLTKYRDGLCPIPPVDREGALRAVRLVESFGETSLAAQGARVFYASDELYLAAGLPLPDPDFYGGFPQLENGVGMTALFADEFERRLAALSGDARFAPATLATGRLFAPTLRALVEKLRARDPKADLRVVPIRNDFFGESITVAGLVTGGDLISQLRERELGGRLFFPSSMLRAEGDRFLDDVTPEEVAAALGVPAIPVPGDGGALIDRLLEAPRGGA